MPPPSGSISHHPLRWYLPFLVLLFCYFQSLSLCTLSEGQIHVWLASSHSSLWLQEEWNVWVKMKYPYYVHALDITPDLHPDSLLSADGPIPQLGILEMLMAHWELSFMVASQGPMTSWFKRLFHFQRPPRYRLRLSCNCIACPFLVSPVLPSSPSYRSNCQERFPVNSGRNSPFLSLFSGNSI